MWVLSAGAATFTLMHAVEARVQPTNARIAARFTIAPFFDRFSALARN